MKQHGGSMKQHRIGVIGYGVWGTHALQEILLRQEGVELAAVHAHDRWGYGNSADPVAAGRAYAAAKGCAFQEDWMAIVADPDIDILSVMTSPASKPEVVVAGLACGKSIVTDKPLALDAAGARRMLEAERHSSGIGMVLCGNHYSRPCEKFREIIREGRLGEIKHVDARLYFTGGIYPGFRPTERYCREVPGGELTVIGTHAIQTLLALNGRRPLTVVCRTGQKFYPEYAAVGYEDWAELLLTLEGGVTAGISVGRLPHRPERALPLVEVSGTRGYATVEGDALTVWPGPQVYRDDETQEQRYDRLFAAFLRAVESGEEAPIRFAELYQVQRVLEAAYTSAREGKPVKIPGG